MNMKSMFTISDVLRTSWKALVSQVWILAGLLIGYIIFSLILSLILGPIFADSLLGTLLLNVFSTIVSILFTLGYLKNLFQALDGEEPRFSAYGQQARKIGTLFVSNFLLALVCAFVSLIFLLPYFYWLSRFPFVQEFAGALQYMSVYGKVPQFSGGASLFYAGLGGIVLCLPAIYIAIRASFFQAFIVEEDAGIIESIRKSWAITKGQEWRLVLLILVSIALMIAGLCLFFVGVFIAVPLTGLMFCCAFRRLNRVVQPEESLLE
jgi:hypothetical protein